MKAESFLDTNILVYAVDCSAGNVKKHQLAMDLIASVDFGVSAQVLQEFYVTVTRKLCRPMGVEEAVSYLDRLNAFPTVSTDYGLVVEGIRNSLKFGISYWDGTIVAAAARLGADVLYSEDLNHGQHYGTVEVQNPFRELL